MAWPCTHSGFTNNNVTVLYLRTCSSRGVLELGVFSLSVFRTFGGLLHYIWIYACALIPKRKTIFSFNFLIFFPAGLFKLIWKQSLEYFCISREVNIQLVLPFFFSFFFLERFVHMGRSLWQIPPICADVGDAFEASLLCSAGVPAQCCHLASKQAFVAKEHNVCFCLWDSFCHTFIQRYIEQLVNSESF